MNPTAIRTTLFVTFIAIFVATATITLLAITNVISIHEGYLNTLFTSLIMEIVGAVVVLFRSASFFGSDTRADAALIVGAWWEFISDKPNFALSFVQISHSPKTGYFLLEGEAYSDAGQRVADWRTSIAWLDPASLQLVYLWSGNESHIKTGELTGFGVLRFRSDNREIATRGFGWFISPGGPASTTDTRAQVEMRRAAESDREVMLGSDAAAKSKLVVAVNASR